MIYVFCFRLNRSIIEILTQFITNFMIMPYAFQA